ncbi:hypothetical protein OHA72_52440 [Dactylosporangium sp. NBC_01737]|uniref:hypothetical protein n=1 Tax=Dactylosporangium sp. NBC_01737 TaxID=2975959 RepID=UPI002E100099|nr:hypothetical protein OHA72_52440 [Dactylosporangium sp. NBC_01737]
MARSTAAYLDFRHGTPHGARAYVPGREEPVHLGLDDLRDWGTTLGRLPDGMRPPRRIEVHHSAPLLQFLIEASKQVNFVLFASADRRRTAAHGPGPGPVRF